MRQNGTEKTTSLPHRAPASRPFPHPRLANLSQGAHRWSHSLAILAHHRLKSPHTCLDGSRWTSSLPDRGWLLQILMPWYVPGNLMSSIALATRDVAAIMPKKGSPPRHLGQGSQGLAIGATHPRGPKGGARVCSRSSEASVSRARTVCER